MTEQLQAKDDYAMPSYPMFGVTSFAELDEVQGVYMAAEAVEQLADHFCMIASNIVLDESITDKAAALRALAKEFSARVNTAVKTKEDGGFFAKVRQYLKRQPEDDTGGDFMAEEKAATKREDGKDYPKGDFAYTPSDNPSEWKLRLTESPGAEPTVAQLGRAAAAFSAGGFRGNRVELPSNAVAGVKRRIRSEYAKLGVKPDDIPASVKESFSVWKTKEGAYRWLAVYSNQFRDSDYPPEILSEKAHKTFVAMVDAGLVDYPELWHWHIPGTAWGKADWVAYDNGFALASGYILPGHEKEAELVSQMEDIRVSHGMPSRLIVRNKEDSSIIDMYVSVEISDLPGYAAANKLTDFVMFNNKEFEMLSQDKRKYLVDAGLDDETISQIEAQLDEKAQAAKNAGIEAKEQETKEEPATEQPPVVTADYATKQEVADVFAGALKPLAEAIATLQSTLTSVQAEVKALKQTDEEKVAAKAAATPQASLAELIAQSFSTTSALDGRSALAKAGPKQTQPDSAKYTGVPFLDGLISQTQQGVSQ